MIRAGVVGWPVSHSLSPLIHRAWIRAAALDADYGAFPAEDEAAFDVLIRQGLEGLIHGLNVTAPWKLRALAVADEASSRAIAAGSANLLTFRDGRVRATSTDGEGLIVALREQAPNFEAKDAAAVVLGAGGAARAAAAALKAEGARVTIVNRSRDRAQDLAQELEISAGTWSDAITADLIVNALPVQPDHDLAILKPSAVVMDMTYRPLITPLLSAARNRSLIVVDGLAMLIGQARPSFRAIYGVPEPDVDVRTLALTTLEATP